MKLKQIIPTLLIICLAGNLVSQDNINLEAIWKEYEFQDKTVPGFQFLNDGLHYSKLDNNRIQKLNLISGRRVTNIFDASIYKGLEGFSGNINGYSFNRDETFVLIESESEPIYRRSKKAIYFMFDILEKKLYPVFSDQKISFPSFSPDSKHIAFVFSNNLYVRNIESGETVKATKDGNKNSVINGAADWVYEEEFAMSKAYYWGPDSKRISFLRFDESDVQEFTLTNYNNGSYPEYKVFKYPKVGEKNASVSVHIYYLDDQKLVTANLGEGKDVYIPRIKWTKDKNKLVAIKLNRHQNHLQLFLVDARDGKSQVILEEKNKYYIDITDDLFFLKNGKEFIWTSEKSGYNHIYLYDLNGKEKKQLTSGNHDITSFYGVDEKRNLLFFQAAELTPLERQVYSVSLKDGLKTLYSDFSGINKVQFSKTFDYYIWTKSTINSPPVISVHNHTGNQLRVIEDNEEVIEKQQQFGANEVEFFDFVIPSGEKLNGYMIKPDHFKENRRYPVFMYLYGGPGSQKATNGWKGQDYWWFQMLAQEGYLVACIDNRGTGGRGEEFRKMTYLKLGHFETLDQISGAKYLASLPYTDPARIGIFGWSYGGFMSTLCLLKGNDIFKSAIAVAPVTHWKWYDSIYTERYMRTEEENADGYLDNSPVLFADRLKGNYLLVHGMGDDNVHFQHTAEMANALIKANKQFDTYFYPNRTHGISGDLTRLHLYTKMSKFIFEKL